jgi:hypothetical protein
MEVCRKTTKLAYSLLISVRPYGCVMGAVPHINPRGVWDGLLPGPDLRIAAAALIPSSPEWKIRIRFGPVTIG